MPLSSKTLNTCSLLILTACLTAPVFAHAHGQTCADKLQAVNNQIKYATTYHNPAELNRLKIARSQIIANCNDNDLTQKYQDKVEKYQQQLARDQSQLARARVNGDPHKIEKAEKRVAKTLRKLQEAKADRARFHGNLKR
ncbi:DUF1090 domain-containing protein [Neisseriaceae bacterium ESL0693]|nr:DUF1090 domain-containing protein [Neisseriaceae bacterium ESL0693]